MEYVQIAEDETDTIRTIFDKFINTDMGHNGACLLSNIQKKKEFYIALDVEMADYYRIKNEEKGTGKL